jgi:hypothetical protein
MFLTHPADGSALAPALATTRAEPAVFDNGAAPSDPNADFDDGPGNTPQADVSPWHQQRLATCSARSAHAHTQSLLKRSLISASLRLHMLTIGPAVRCAAGAGCGAQVIIIACSLPAAAQGIPSDQQCHTGAAQPARLRWQPYRHLQHWQVRLHTAGRMVVSRRLSVLAIAHA